MTGTERWLPVPGYVGLYEVSTAGQVRSLSRSDTYGRPVHARLLKVGMHVDGYKQVCLYRKGEKRNAPIHRLVLLAFSGEPEPGQLVRHLNGIPGDNRLENLQWGTAKENYEDALRHGTISAEPKTHCPRGHEYAGGNVFIDRKGVRICRTCRKARDDARRPARAAQARARRAAIREAHLSKPVAEWDANDMATLDRDRTELVGGGDA